jgi:hypothetical protein
MNTQMKIRYACYIAIKNTPLTKSASIVRRELNINTLEVFGRHIVKTAGFGSLSIKLKQLYEGFQKMPEYWNRFKEMIGMSAISTWEQIKEFDKKFGAFLEKGKLELKSILSKLDKEFEIVHIFIQVYNDIPTLTNMLHSLIEKLPTPIQKFLKGIGKKAKSFAKVLDDILSHSHILKALSVPIKAYIYWKIWTTVTEISWDIVDIVRGMLGMISWEELIESLPESGVGYVLTLLIPDLPGGMILKALKIGWNILLPAAITFQMYWLYKNGYITKNLKPITQ